MASADESRGRHRGRDVERRAARRSRGAKAHLDAHEAASKRRHRDARACAGAAGANRLDRRSRRGRRRRGDGRARARRRLPREARWRPHRRRAGCPRRLPGAHRVAALKPEERALVLIGFMGAGKSRALRAVREAGLEATDADRALERELGGSIAEFFDRQGEAEFRRREEALVPRLVERSRGGAIALGGGAVHSEAVRHAIADHVVVWLQVGVEDAWDRAARHDRPLARDREAFAALLRAREPLYRTIADAVLPPGDDVAARAPPHLLALRSMPAGTRLLWGASSSGEYPAYIGP